MALRVGRPGAWSRLALRAGARHAAPLSMLRAVPFPHFEHAAIAVATPRLGQYLQRPPEKGTSVLTCLSGMPVVAGRDWFFGEPMVEGGEAPAMQLSSVKKKRLMKMNKHKRAKRRKRDRMKKRTK